MLEHEIEHKPIRAWKVYCKLHGEKCPNEYNEQPGYAEAGWKEMDHQTPLGVLERESGSKCPIAALFAMLGILRRAKQDPSIAANYGRFFSTFRDHVWYVLNKAHSRVLISILDTYADCPATRDVGTAAVVFLRMGRLAAMVDDPKRINDPKVELYTKTIVREMGVMSATAPDTLDNMLLRLQSVLSHTPLLWLLFYEILKYDLRFDNLFQRYDRLKPYKVWNWPEIAMLERVYHLLQPSTVNLKYLNLYKKQHEIPEGYGGGTNFPGDDLKFILDNKSKNLLDFGCGQGRRYSNLLEWHRYDPCRKEFSELPYRNFDSLISYDVLEHIPVDELKVTAKWLNLFASKCMVLGISTVSARAILPNGENAHCTVRPPTWWADTMQKFLPRFRLVSTTTKCINSPHYVTLYFVMA